MTGLLSRTLVALLALIVSMHSWAVVNVSDAKDPLPILESTFQGAEIGPKVPVGEDNLPVRTVYKGDEVVGYAFETNDIVDIPAYSGAPINTLVMMEPNGEFIHSVVLEHHEPILLVGIPEQKLFDFVDQYDDMKVTDRVRVGAANTEGVISVDAVAGATVTVMVVNEAIMRASKKVGIALGMPGLEKSTIVPPSTVKEDVFQQADWQTLVGDGSIRTLVLNRGQIDEAFMGTEAEEVDVASPEKKQDLFIELAYAPLNIPTIGRNLLGDEQYNWLKSELNEGDHAIAVFGNGRYSFKGNGFVRGGIFDRTQMQQNEKVISFHDTDYYRFQDFVVEGYPGFKETAIFIIRSQYEFDHGSPWQLELLVRRQVGALDSVFTSFFGDYMTKEEYITRPVIEVIEEEEPEPLWVSVWRDKTFQITVLSISLVLLTAIIFFQDYLVRYPRLLNHARHLFLVYTVVFIGWYTLGQLSVVNVFTFTHALMGDFRWELFLLDPIIFILWAYVAMTLLLWGRGIFCGWLCPFGALQELINHVSRKLKIKQWEPPFAVHERLWAVKYIILLALFAVSLESIGEAERYAEVEPFKTAIMLKFQREWGYVFYAGILLLISVVNRKFYCRYVCPLGAALAIPSKARLFDWLKRRKECGQPCKICANECEIQAIHPDGSINANECHYCLDCQMSYYNDHKCPPLVQKRRKREKEALANKIPAVEVGATAN
ncbi:regulatory protein NosR [Motiliproteus coralliicola]|uniref:Regulatory protein NosR n=1 Tax=Motiliproteus coralliicola TaxID=2283196 RepID=A0A369WFN5_9GAMM|nr:NosR/NirI family protein [Motiliproteus coralliicola]RDE18285.1 regulatory protein NosR [Motiliproteus coralliicola]